MIRFGTGGWRAIIADEFTKENIRLVTAGLCLLMQKEGYAIALSDALVPILDNPAFIRHFGDIIDYRTMHYYRSRYEDKKKTS